MQSKKLFIRAMLGIALIVLGVYLSGISVNRSLYVNGIISTSIISFSLFLYLAVGLYKGLTIYDNFPSFNKLIASKKLMYFDGSPIDKPTIDFGDDIFSAIISAIVWLVLGILFIILLALLEAIFWLILAVLIVALYWVCYNAINLVFIHAKNTKGKPLQAIGYALGYTALYTGWLLAILIGAQHLS